MPLIGVATSAATFFKNALRDCEFISFLLFGAAALISEAIKFARLSDIAIRAQIHGCHQLSFKIEPILTECLSKASGG